MRKIDGIFRRKLWSKSTSVRPSSRFKIFGSSLMAGLLLAAISFGIRPVGAAVDLAQLVQDGRYMIAFQNNTELRPSGGFLGSFAIIDIKDRQLKQYWFETNIYKMDNEFSKQMMIPPPKPLAESWPGRSWALNSSNWAPDFYEAASTMKWFYELEYQDKLDGIIAVNATVMTQLLNMLGPISLPKHDITITAENFLMEVQWKVEKEYFEAPENLIENEPKTILRDLLTVVLERVKRLDDPADLWRLVEQSLEKKEIQMAFFGSQAAQSIAQKRNWAGRIRETLPPDQYLLVNNANLHGGKGSLGVKQKIKYEWLENGQGQSEVTLAITRINQGRADGWEVGENRNFTRVLVPLGSRLMDVTIDKEPIKDVSAVLESNKTSFGFWFTTPLHQTKTATIRYQLPQHLRVCNLRLICSTQSPQLVIQRQSGPMPDDVSVYRNGLLIWQGSMNQDKSITL